MDGLCQRSALANSDDVTFVDSEAWRAVGNDVLMSLLIPVVLFDEVEIVSSEDDGVSHLVGDAHASEDLASDADISGEGALLVNVVSLDGLGRGLESQTHVFVVSDSLAGLGGQNFLIVKEDSILFLVCLLSLLNHANRFIIFRFIKLILEKIELVFGFHSLTGLWLVHCFLDSEVLSREL